MITHENANRQRLLYKLDDMLDQEMFDLLDDATKEKLNDEFVEKPDQEDFRELLLAVARRSKKLLTDLEDRYAGAWESFVAEKVSDYRYRAEIERNFLARYEDE
jgi:hypothetical protein